MRRPRFTKSHTAWLTCHLQGAESTEPPKVTHWAILPKADAHEVDANADRESIFPSEPIA